MMTKSSWFVSYLSGLEIFSTHNQFRRKNSCRITGVHHAQLRRKATPQHPGDLPEIPKFCLSSAIESRYEDSLSEKEARKTWKTDFDSQNGWLKYQTKRQNVIEYPKYQIFVCFRLIPSLTKQQCASFSESKAQPAEGCQVLEVDQQCEELNLRFSCRNTNLFITWPGPVRR